MFIIYYTLIYWSTILIKSLHWAGQQLWVTLAVSVQFLHDLPADQLYLSYLISVVMWASRSGDLITFITVSRNDPHILLHLVITWPYCLGASPTTHTMHTPTMLITVLTNDWAGWLSCFMEIIDNCDKWTRFVSTSQQAMKRLYLSH